MEKVVIIGARFDGHAKVVFDILQQHKEYRAVCFLDDTPELEGKSIFDIPILGNRNKLSVLYKKGIKKAIVGIGKGSVRLELAGLAKKEGLGLINAIHPESVISPYAQLGKGIMVAAGAVINPGAVIGDNVVINTGATIDHDCLVEEGVSVSPGAHLSGRVILRERVFVGTGAAILPDIEIGKASIVGAGAVVIENVGSNLTVAGVPAKIIKK